MIATGKERLTDHLAKEHPSAVPMLHLNLVSKSYLQRVHGTLHCAWRLTPVRQSKTTRLSRWRARNKLAREVVSHSFHGIPINEPAALSLPPDPAKEPTR